MRLIADMQISMNVLLSIQLQCQLLIIRETQDLGCISTKGWDYRDAEYPQLTPNSMEVERFLGCPLADLITIRFSSAAVHMLLLWKLHTDVYRNDREISEQSVTAKKEQSFHRAWYQIEI